MSVLDSAAINKNENPVWLSIQAMVNQAVKDQQYFVLNRPAWQVAAAAVAPPVCATATVTSKAKTTATTQLYVAGVPLSLTATDNLWDLTPDAANILAAGSVRRYLLCWSGASATTVMSVIPSGDKVTASFASVAVAIAACRWPSLPPTGIAIVGILSISNVTNPFIPGTTLLGAAGVTATYVDGFDGAVPVASLQTP